MLLSLEEDANKTNAMELKATMVDVATLVYTEAKVELAYMEAVAELVSMEALEVVVVLESMVAPAELV